MESTKVKILCGGESSSEREVSLRSGENIYQMCKEIFPTEKIVLNEDKLPLSIFNEKDSIIFPLLHGEFGEDGKLQKLLEDSDFQFIGSGSKASARCMDKTITKAIAASLGIPTIQGINFTSQNMSKIKSFAEQCEYKLFIKPNAKGSSVDTHIISSIQEFETLSLELNKDIEYIAEKKIDGIDLTVGVFAGKSLEIVEIIPKHGFLDYDNKYTVGKSEKICPANISNNAELKLKRYSELIFQHCGCRDWSRVDFMIQNDGKIFFLEANTVPGMTATSYFPISAQAAGFSIPELVKNLVMQATNRHLQAINSQSSSFIAKECVLSL